jgi:hypothetical protein
MRVGVYLRNCHPWAILMRLPWDNCLLVLGIDNILAGMDLLAHACYGAVLCSRSGLAGGRQGLPGRRWYRDGTLWLAVFFGLLPDIVSMWVPYGIPFWRHGWFMVAYWAVLAALVISIILCRALSRRPRNFCSYFCLQSFVFSL